VYTHSMYQSGAHTFRFVVQFLCNRDGVPVKRYAPTTAPLDIVSDIEELL
jgi:glutathione peroxidase-family protein